MRRHAFKLPLIHMLDDVAQHMTHSRRPVTRPLPTRPSYSKFHHQYVLKRSHSSGGDHVHRLLPGEPIPWDHSPGTCYFLQEYVDWLATMGEARVGIIGGCKIIFRTWTNRRASDATTSESLWEYFELEASTSPPQSLHPTSSSTSPSSTSASVATPDDEPLAATIIGRNLAALDSFALAALSATIAEEKARFGFTSLEIFARMDIAITPSEDGKSFSYFVNEIERMPGGCFWALDSGAGDLSKRASEVSESLSAYLTRADRGILSRGVRAEWWAYHPVVASS